MADQVTQAELEAACQAWVKRLRLQDWKVSASFDTWHSLDNRTGAINYNRQHKAATIRVMTPEHYCERW